MHSVSTRTEGRKQTGGGTFAARRLSGPSQYDPADAVARVALARRDLLLRVHRHRLRIEDLEDCYSQATLELLSRARSGAQFENATHISNALEQKLVSRINDRRRAVSGRSPIETALGQAASLDDPDSGSPDVADRAAAVHDRVVRRMDLGRVREVAEELTPDQRLVLATQVGLDMSCDDFCQRYGWSPDKFRKVAQRARHRLTKLVEEYGSGERCRRLEPDLIAHVARVASEDQSARIRRHLANCATCRGAVRELRSAERRVVAIVGGGGSIGNLIGAGAGGATAGGVAAGGAVAGGGAAGGGALLLGGVGGVKAGLAALCLAGLTGGGLLLCSGPRAHERPLPVHRVVATSHRSRRVASAARVDAAHVGAHQPAISRPHDRTARGVAGAERSANTEFGLRSMTAVRAEHPAGRPGRAMSAALSLAPAPAGGERARRVSRVGPAAAITLGFERR
jgi:DNA-directed RNA polymerase specialized sigma24 family protein